MFRSMTHDAITYTDIACESKHSWLDCLYRTFMTCNIDENYVTVCYGLLAKELQYVMNLFEENIELGCFQLSTRTRACITFANEK